MNLSSFVRTTVYLWAEVTCWLCDFVVVRKAVFCSAALFALLAADAFRCIVKNSFAHEHSPRPQRARDLRPVEARSPRRPGRTSAGRSGADRTAPSGEEANTTTPKPANVRRLRAFPDYFSVFT